MSDDAGHGLPAPASDPQEKEVVKGLISVVIPTYNESSTIRNFVNVIEPLRKNGTEIIFADGGSSDDTLSLIPKNRGFVILSSPQKGRAQQMNYAADCSHGEILFFLHCDTERIPEDAEAEIRRVMSRYEAGCFGIDFLKKDSFFMWTCKWISNHRVKDRKVMFGDQGIFLKRELFYRAGKYPEIPIMEDYQFSLTLKLMQIRLGMTKKRIFTSARRFQGSTYRKLRLMWQMNRLRAAYRRGVPAAEIAKAYRDIR